MLMVSCNFIYNQGEKTFGQKQKSQFNTECQWCLYSFTGTTLCLNSKVLSQQRCQCWFFDVTLACVTVLWAMNKCIDVPLIMSVLNVDAPTSFSWHGSPLCPKYISVTFYLWRRRAWGKIERGQVRELERERRRAREEEGERERWSMWEMEEETETDRVFSFLREGLIDVTYVTWSFQFPFVSSLPHKRASSDYAWPQRISWAGTGIQPSRSHDSLSCSELHLVLWNALWFVDGSGRHNYFTTFSHICMPLICN